MRPIVAAALLLSCAPLAARADTLDKVRGAKTLSCGVVIEPLDWNKDDLHGPLAALDAGICHAVAVAAAGPGVTTALTKYPAEQEAEAGLAAGEVDLVVGVTPSVGTALRQKIWFGPPVFYDAQGFLFAHDPADPAPPTVAGKKICFVEGTDAEKTVQARTVGRGVAVNLMPFQEEGEMDDGLLNGHCDAISADLSKLAETRASFHNPGDFVLLPETLTLHPAAPAYRQGDPRWAALVEWTVHALVSAEALGVTRANAGELPPSDEPAMKRLTGGDWASADALGLPHDWALQVVGTVGNYGEIYEATVGAGSPLKLPRGLNALWTNGGMMAPLPLR